MRRTLHDGFSQFEILDKDENILSFRDIPTTVDFLRRFAGDPVKLGILRGLLTGANTSTAPADTEEILKQVASKLVSGQLRILRSLRLSGGGSDLELGGAEQAEKKTEPPTAPKKENSWIEIYLRDTEGKPVPGERYRIKLPDGSIEEGRLDADGHVEYYGINPGACVVSFPDIDAKE